MLSSIDCGVPQGSISGPLLVVNDIPKTANHFDIVSFADDASLFLSDPNRRVIL